MIRTSRVAAIAALTLLLVACSGGGATPASSGPASPGPSGSAEALCERAPDPTSLPDEWDTASQSPSVIPLIVTNQIVCGQARIVFLFLDDAQRVVSSPDRTATVAFYDLATDPDTPVTTAESEFVWAIPDERGMYVVNADLPHAGIWGAEITTEAPQVPTEKIRMTFEVADSTPTVQVGAPAPASDSPTAADVDGDLSQISTDEDPVPAFYETSVADALAAHEPFVLAFATPKFCTSQQCGPTLDSIKPIAEAHPDVTFINVEPYVLEYTDGQLQPVLDANEQLQAAPTTDEWGLLSEPWIFVVDGDGDRPRIVRGRRRRGGAGARPGRGRRLRDGLAALLARPRGGTRPARHPRSGTRRGPVTPAPGARRGDRAGTRRRFRACRWRIRARDRRASGA